MKITEEMVQEFNQKLEDANCCFKLLLRKSYVGDNSSCDIVPANNKYVESYIINPTKEFYKDMEYYFGEQGITLDYNNTRTIFWSTSGWSK